jgi:hypothetical protein
MPREKKKFPIEVEIYQCGGVRIDGMWYNPLHVEDCAYTYAAISRDLDKPFVFSKREDTAKSTAERITDLFTRRLEWAKQGR